MHIYDVFNLKICLVLSQFISMFLNQCAATQCCVTGLVQMCRLKLNIKYYLLHFYFNMCVVKYEINYNYHRKTKVEEHWSI